MTKRKEIFLIFICWLAYTFAQLGRYTYGSNVTLIMDRFAVDHTEAGIPSTLFFFAYGVGQLIVGLFCHKFNRKMLVIIALILSGVINLIIFLGAEFFTIKYLWLVNGFVQANLWPVLLLILRENLSVERIEFAGVVMATASAGGKFAAIGVCALFAIDTNAFMYCFLAAAVLLFVGAILFFFVTGNIKKPERIESNKPRAQNIAKRKSDKQSIILLLLLGEFSLASYAIIGGLQSWVPSILKDSYELSDAVSIFMSVLLPLFTLTVAFFAPFLYRKLKNYVFISLLSFALGALLIGGVILFLDVHWLPIMILFTVEAITMTVVSNTTTVQVPLTFKGEFNAGFLAGYLNGACYIGTAIATYVLGYIADASGWIGAFILLIAIAALSALLAFIYLLFFRKKNNVDFQNETN